MVKNNDKTNTYQQALDAASIPLNASDLSESQLQVIISGINMGIDATIYANEKHSAETMQQLFKLMQNCQKQKYKKG